MIVKNEAANLSRCLNSVKGIVNELIVLDTGSTDSTVAIARSLGAQVYSFEWCNDFSIARNVALQYVTGDWVLVLDADEVLVPDVVPLLRQAMQQEWAIVVNLVRQEVGAVQSPYSLVSRLFRRHPDVTFSRPYHAMVDDSVAALLQREPQWQVVNCPEVAILHYGYEPGTIASRQKLATAQATMEGFLAANPQDPYVCSKLGALYVQLGDLPRGIELLQRGIGAGQFPPSEITSEVSAAGLQSATEPVQYELHYHLGIAYSKLGDRQQAEQHYQLALKQPILETLKLGAYNNLGSLQQVQGHWAEAERLYRAAIAIDPQFATGYYNLGMVLKAQGQLSEAIGCYQRAIALNPAYADAHQNLGVALLKGGRVLDALEAFKAAIALHESQNPQEAVRLRQGLQAMGLQV